MSVADAPDADQPYEQVNGQLMDEMWQAAQEQDQGDQDQGGGK